MKRLLLLLTLGWLAADTCVAAAATMVQNRARFNYALLNTITFDSANGGGWTSANASPSITVDSGGLVNGNGTIGFHWYAATARTISSVTFDGVAATLVDVLTVDLGGGSETGFAVYGLPLAGKASGTYTVQINFSGTVDEGAMGVVVHHGVHQTTAYGTPVKNTAAGATTETATISSAVGEVVIDLFGQTDTAITVGVGQTQRWKQDNASTFADAQCSTEPGASSVTMTWASDPAAELGYGYILVSLKPAP